MEWGKRSPQEQTQKQIIFFTFSHDVLETNFATHSYKPNGKHLVFTSQGINSYLGRCQQLWPGEGEGEGGRLKYFAAHPNYGLCHIINMHI